VLLSSQGNHDVDAVFLSSIGKCQGRLDRAPPLLQQRALPRPKAAAQTNLTFNLANFEATIDELNLFSRCAVDGALSDTNKRPVVISLAAFNQIYS
jgi:hypothetical protein